MATWHIEETRNLIETLYGRAQTELARPCLQSVIDRRNYAHYHYHEASSLFESFANEKLADSSLIEVVWSPDENTRADFDLLITKIGANVLACIQSLHSIADILAHAAYYSLGLNLSVKPLREADITVVNVLKRLRQSSDLSLVHHHMTSLVQGGLFDHLSALSNYSRHRNIIRTALAEDWTGKAPERHKLKLGAFRYKNCDYPETEVRGFIEAEFNRSAQLIVDTGTAIHAALQSRML